MKPTPESNRLFVRQLVLDLLEAGDLPRALFFPALDTVALNIPRFSGLLESEIQVVIEDCVGHRLIASVESECWADGLLAITESGVLTWAELAHPDWEKYWELEIDFSSMTLTAVSRQTLEEMVTKGPWDRTGDVTWEEARRFEALPGFIFESAWKATFPVGTHNVSEYGAGVKFYRSHHWYRDAWDVPGWPFPRETR